MIPEKCLLSGFCKIPVTITLKNHFKAFFYNRIIFYRNKMLIFLYLLQSVIFKVKVTLKYKTF